MMRFLVGSKTSKPEDTFQILKGGESYIESLLSDIYFKMYFKIEDFYRHIKTKTSHATCYIGTVPGILPAAAGGSLTHRKD